MATPKRVKLALGSGGARGYAHIGVIAELQDRGYEIVGVAGSSMGALVGGLFAAGHLANSPGGQQLSVNSKLFACFDIHGAIFAAHMTDLPLTGADLDSARGSVGGAVAVAMRIVGQTGRRSWIRRAVRSTRH